MKLTSVNYLSPADPISKLHKVTKCQAENMSPTVSRVDGAFCLLSWIRRFLILYNNLVGIVLLVGRKRIASVATVKISFLIFMTSF